MLKGTALQALNVFCLAAGFGLYSCSVGPTEQRASGTAGVLVFALSDSVDVRIPGTKTDSTWTLNNGTESIHLQSSGAEDGCWTVPIFEGTICMNGQVGEWHDVLRPGHYAVPVAWESTPGPADMKPHANTLSWRLTFGVDDPWFGDLTVHQTSDGQVFGSISTATGDFRFLHGQLSDSAGLIMQTFDGAHLFRFSATSMPDGTLTDGVFLSGNHYATSFTGAVLLENDSPLSEGKEASWTGEMASYTGINLDGSPTQWNAASATGTHILSIMGSWCPNCMDEHRLLVQLMNRHPDLKVHTLAFERGLDKDDGVEKALNRLNRYASQMGADRWDDRWTFVLAGPASKKAAADSLAFVDRVVSFPTTVVINENQQEPWIHTGFNGPATGPAYEVEVAKFNRAINAGLTENR